ncbi:MAG: glutamine synthetase [Desertifilum sp. SIO1I2]|nr:glutamine synthetase [Desertifilum sp. SIO1I2]
MGEEDLNNLEEEGIRFIRIVWCDNANAIRGKAVHIRMMPHYLDRGVGISAAQQAVPILYDAPVPGGGLGPVGEIQLIPDWSTYVSLPYAPGHGRVMGNMYHQGEPWPLCPRHFLATQAQQAAELGLEAIAAFENEFYLLKQTAEGRIEPSDRTLFASTQAMDLHQAVIDEIAEALIAQGLLVEQYYPESGPGQQEISILYNRALAAADQQIAFRETVRAIAHQHHLTVSFLPKIFADAAGSGCHIHLSLWHQGENRLSDPSGLLGLSEVGRQFIGGILHHLPGLMALTAPTCNSYRRIQPQSWSGAFRCWGLDNREAAIRVIGNPEGTGSNHFELKTVDASANPYIALGGMIAAGLDGVYQGLEPDEPLEIDPGSLTEAERQKRKIERLPENLGAAIEALTQDEVLLNALGSPLAQAYLAVRKAEWEALKDVELEDEVKLLLERY